jgi:hypothetical protein
MNRQDACFTKHQVSCGVGRRARPKSTGKMRVPQNIKFFVAWAEESAQNQQARCVFHKTSSFLWGGPKSPPKETGKMPVPQ